MPREAKVFSTCANIFRQNLRLQLQPPCVCGILRRRRRRLQQVEPATRPLMLRRLKRSHGGATLMSGERVSERARDLKEDDESNVNRSMWRMRATAAAQQCSKQTNRARFLFSAIFSRRRQCVSARLLNNSSGLSMRLLVGLYHHHQQAAAAAAASVIVA